MVETDASDIYLTDGITPMFRIEGMVQPYGEKSLSGADTEAIAQAIMNEKQRMLFVKSMR